MATTRRRAQRSGHRRGSRAVILQRHRKAAHRARTSRAPAIAQVSDIFVERGKAVLFGYTAGIVAAAAGSTRRRAPKGVGDAVNQSVVISFVLVFLINL
jgi:phospholipid/cholesterol/gamma-HCH transport system permease protein